MILYHLSWYHVLLLQSGLATGASQSQLLKTTQSSPKVGVRHSWMYSKGLNPQNWSILIFRPHMFAIFSISSMKSDQPASPRL